MDTTAIVLTSPGHIELRDVSLIPATETDVTVTVIWSGISTGTEKMLWEGSMPSFPGMGYPLIPGYEAVGRVLDAPVGTGFARDDLVFVPGANCYADARGLFGANARQVIVPAARLVPLPESLGKNGVLLALAATAYHALVLNEAALPELIVGHGVLGRLLARLVVALDGEPPTVWENNPARRADANGYDVISGEGDPRKDYRMIMDASGDARILDTAVAHLARKGEITLAGFYAQPLSLNFPPAFMREARFRIAAEFEPADVYAVLDLIGEGHLTLDGLISHTAPVMDVAENYRRAFTDPECLKMILEWEGA